MPVYFYQGKKVNVRLGASSNWTAFRYGAASLAEMTSGGSTEVQLQAVDVTASVLLGLGRERCVSRAYASYGVSDASGSMPSLGFNGELQDRFTGGYLLGNGVRCFKPSLMRFCSADRYSPFGVGGLNAYAYCAGDPVNNTDPSGHIPSRWLSVRGVLYNAAGVPRKSELPSFLNIYEKRSVQRVMFRHGDRRAVETIKERNAHLHTGKLPRKATPVDDPGFLGQWTDLDEEWRLLANDATQLPELVRMTWERRRRLLSCPPCHPSWRSAPPLAPPLYSTVPSRLSLRSYSPPPHYLEKYPIFDIAQLGTDLRESGIGPSSLG